MSIDEREAAPPKAAMSISSLLDSGRGVSPPNATQRYASPSHKEEYDMQRSRSRVYSASPPSPAIERRPGASISDLLDDGGDARRPLRNVSLK